MGERRAERRSRPEMAGSADATRGFRRPPRPLPGSSPESYLAALDPLVFEPEVSVRSHLLLVLAGLALVACPDGSGRASKKSPSDTLTTRQRDSVLGESPIPGAGGVRKALELQDSARARNARIDSIGGN